MKKQEDIENGLASDSNASTEFPTLFALVSRLSGALDGRDHRKRSQRLG